MLRTTFSRRAAALGLAGTLAVAGAASANAASRRGSASSAGATAVLTRQVIPNLASYQVLGRSNPGQRVQVGVSIASPHAAAEAAFAKALYTPGSPAFHHFLTPSQRAARFGVDATTVARIQRSVTADGLSVAYASPDGTYLLLAGTVGQVERTFSVTEEDHRGLDGSTFRANAQGPTVPAGVSAVLGLTSIGMKRSQDICSANVCTGTLTAQDLWSVYDQPSNDRGTGQGAAIFGEGDLNQPVKDLRAYEAFKGFPQVPVRRILVADDQTDTSGLGEWDLDETAITGMSPDLAQLSYYFGQDLGDASILGTWQAWANDSNGPAIGNSSFGGCEFLQVATGGQVAFDQVLQALTEEGRTMFNATGDTGGSCAAVIAINGVQNNGVPTVQSPASSPFVTAVGGTVLYTQASSATPSNTSMTQPATRAEEYAWTHTGGGTSYFEPAPQWQQDIPVIAGRCVAGPDLSSSAAGAQCKGVPDVAALSGDILTNGYETGDGTIGGGTSLSSPLWAGMWARVLAAHSSTCAGTGTAGPIGFATPALYQLAKSANGTKAFFDITTGTNGQWTALPRNAGDPTGWDYVSGLGVPDVSQIMQVLDCGNTTPVSANPALPLDQTVSPSTASCGPNGQLTDPTGDATLFSGVTPNNAATNDDALDLTKVTITADSTGITWTQHVVNLGSDPTELGFEDYFTYGSGSFDLLADNGAPTGPPTFTLNSVDPTTGSFTTVIDKLPGSFDPATNTVSITLPYAAYNAAVHPSTPLALGSTLTGLTINADRNLGGLLTPADDASFGVCNYVAEAPTTTGGGSGGHGHKKPKKAKPTH